MVDVICLNPECMYCDKSRCTRDCITISEKLWCEQWIRKEDIKKIFTSEPDDPDEYLKREV